MHTLRLCPYLDVHLPILLRILSIYQANSKKNQQFRRISLRHGWNGSQPQTGRADRTETLLVSRAILLNQRVRRTERCRRAAYGAAWSGGMRAACATRISLTLLDRGGPAEEPACDCVLRCFVPRRQPFGAGKRARRCRPPSFAQEKEDTWSSRNNDRAEGSRLCRPSYRVRLESRHLGERPHSLPTDSQCQGAASGGRTNSVPAGALSPAL